MQSLAIIRTHWVVFTVTILGLLPIRNLHGQGQCTDPSLNNFVHPTGTVTAPVGRLGHVEKRGKGKTALLLIPGAAFGWTVWKEFMDRNADAYTMYAITPAGYDGTPPPEIPTGENFAEQVWTDGLVAGIVELIDKERLDRPIVVGHHMLGDYAALRLAVNHPSKIGGLVVISGTPSFASPAWGQNKPGEPVKLANEDQRMQMVKGYMAPFYRRVTPDMWRAGSFPARRFCKDARRGQELFDQQVAVPIPTQVRYFLEYLSVDLTSQLSKIQVPVLAVVPKQAWDFEAAFDAFREGGTKMTGGSEEQARAAQKAQYIAGWGDVDTALNWTFDQAFQWEQVKSSIPKFSLKQIEGSGIFIMDDQPKLLDDAIREFVTTSHTKK